MQVTVQMNALPFHVNPQRYNMLIAGIVDISKEEWRTMRIRNLATPRS